MVSEEVEDAEPPAPAATVKLDDQQLMEKLVASIQGKEGDPALWTEVLAGLRTREAGPLLDELEQNGIDTSTYPKAYSMEGTEDVCIFKF